MKMKPFLHTLALCLLTLVLVTGLEGSAFSLALSPKGKKLKGSFFEDKMVTGQVEGETRCQLEAGEGVGIQLDWKQENPQFGETTESHLLIWLASWPNPGEKYYFTPENHLLCYQERGSLLLFETFKGQGWMMLDELPQKGRLSGAIDLNLVEPHHNFSNSDYQLVRGELQLKSS